MKKFFTRQPNKSIIISVLTILTTVSAALLGNWNSEQDYFFLKLSFFIAVVLIYIVVLAAYAVHEVNDRKAMGLLKSHVASYECLLSSVISICQNNVSSINKCIKLVNEKGELNLGLWCFDQACKGVCDLIYTCICQFVDSKKFEICYIKLIEGDQKENSVQMVGYANESQSKPTIHKEIRNFDINDSDAYHDLELFKSGKADIEILMTHDEIEEKFVRRGKGRQKEHHQYIGIPVFCDNKKMVGLLEATSFSENLFGLQKDEVYELANKFLVPYANIILLLHKMEKALKTGMKEQGD